MINIETAPVEAQTIEAPVAPTPIEAPTNYLKDLLSGDLKAVPAVDKFKDVNDLFKAYTNLESMLGKKVTNLTPDEIAYFNDQRGIPKEASEYNFEGISDPLKDKFAEVFLKAGLPKNAALELADGYKKIEAEHLAHRESELKALHEKHYNELKSEFGDAFEQRMNIANRAANEFGGNEAVQAIIDAGLHTHPAVVKMFASIGTKMLEDSIPKSQHSSAFGTSPDDAKKRINLALADRDTYNAYYDRFNPKHEIVRKEITDLYAIAYPD